MRWPGKVPAGKVDKASILSAVDLLPTFCELAGVQLPRSYRPDGISQVAALKGNGNSKRTKPLYWKMERLGPPRSQARSLGVLCRGEHAMEISGQ